MEVEYKGTIDCYESAISASLHHPGNVGLIDRRGNNIEEFASCLSEEAKELILSFRKTMGEVKFKNGSRIYFLNFETPECFRGLNIGWFIADSRTPRKEDAIEALKTRLRLRLDNEGKPIHHFGFIK